MLNYFSVFTTAIALENPLLLCLFNRLIDKDVDSCIKLTKTRILFIILFRYKRINFL